MPQFDTSSFQSQIFWLLICLSITFLFARFCFLPRIRRTIDDRENALKNNLEEIKGIEGKINDIKAQNQHKLETHRKKIEQINKDATDKVNLAIETKMEEFRQQAHEQLTSFRAEFKKSLDTFRKNNLSPGSAEIAETIIKKLARAKHSPDLEKQLSSIESLRQK